jgi:ABC-type transporter Mla maintaining outer membrane lipid asymmetry ATPase subunit MlaF
MLREPSMGLAPAIVDLIFERISRTQRESRLTVILVEQRAVEALELCDLADVASSRIGGVSPVIARSSCDEAIQFLLGALDCFADARSDGVDVADWA